MSLDKITKAFLDSRDLLSAIVNKIVRNPSHVEDILQETYIRTYAASHEKEISAAKSYLSRTARNVALNHMALSGIKLNDSLEDIESETVLLNEVSLEQQAEEEQRFIHFCRAVRELPPQCRRVFVLKKVYGFSHNEIAERLGITRKTIEKHIARGILECRDHMRALGHPELTALNTRQPVTAGDRKVK